MLVNELHQGGIRALMDWDHTIFDDMALPSGIDLQDVVDHIIYKYGDAPLMTPEPDVLKYYIKAWSRRRLPLWERYKVAITTEYNPLDNYDRHELRTENREGSAGHTGTVSTDDTGTVSTDDTGTVTDVSNNTVVDQRAADNSDQWSNYDKTQDDVSGMTTNNLNRAEERDLNKLETRNLADEHSETVDLESHIRGNIGVTTSQQMLAAELDIVPRLDLIGYIADDWHAEFNLLIYV